MFDEIASKIAARIQEQLTTKFKSQVRVSLEQPKQSSFGELAVPVAFQLARELKRPPKQIAEELAREIEHMPEIAALEIAGNGYINVRLARGAYAESVLQTAEAETSAAQTEKIIVEH
ncbi:MAG: arginine--tRNA ligase, partial [Bryobacteraceae bacterium]